MKLIITPSFFILAFMVWGQSSSSQVWKIYNDSATYFINQKDPERAIEYFNKVKAVIPPDSVSTDTYIKINKSIADVYYSLEDFEAAIPAYKNLRHSIATTYSEMNRDYAWTCNMLGVLFNKTGQFDSAQAIHLKAKEIREKLFGNKHLAYAQSCNNLGALYSDMGQWDKAEPLLLEAKAIRATIEPSGDRSPYAITCVGLANLYRDMGQYEKAELLYLEAKDIRAGTNKENAEYAYSCNILADLYNNYLQQFDKAEALYLEAKSIREKKYGNKHLSYAQSCNNLGALYRNMEQYAKAEPLLLEAKKIYEKEESEGLSINFNNLGELYYAMGKYKEAASFFLQARQVWQQGLGKDHPYLIANAEELARVYWRMNEPAKAAALFSEAAQLKYNRLNSVFQFTSEKEKQLYLENINGSSDECQSFYYKKLSHYKASPSYEMSLLNRNLILSSIQQTRQKIYNNEDAVIIKLYDVWVGLKEQLAKLYSRGSESKDGPVQAVIAKADSLEKVISRRSAVFKDIQRKIKWKDIQQRLTKNECAIEFIEFRVTDGSHWNDSILYVALILKKETAEPILVPLFEKAQLDNLVQQKTADETTTINRVYSSPALFNLIWRPIEKYIPGITTVYFAPAGNLFRISFGALSINTGQVLSDKYRLIQLNSTGALVNQIQQFITQSDKIQLYGGIEYDADTAELKKLNGVIKMNDSVLRAASGDFTRGNTFRYLPGTAEEVLAIKKKANIVRIKVSILSGIRATEESFNALNGPASPSILHVATHGFFFPDPAYDSRDSIQKKFGLSGKVFRQSANPLLRAGILFAGANNTWKGQYIDGMEDGIVTAYETSNKYLPNTKLVVLSACETALGDIQGSEGVYGLQRAFMIAGAKNLVMSLWKVPDDETSAFMQAFYDKMFKKQSVSDAFYGAQKLMKAKYRNEPFKWAAWVLIK